MPPPTSTRSGPFVVTLHGGKGGIGKTTLAEHLAGGFAEVDTTLLVDADGGQRSAKANYDRYHVKVPFDVAVETDPNLLGNLRKVLYRYVVIDGPPSAAEAKAAVAAADLVIVPMVPRVMDIAAVMLTIKEVIGEGQAYCVVLTRVANNMGTSRVNAVLSALAGNRIPVLQTIVREYMGAHELARTRGLPITHPDVITLSQGDATKERAERAAGDLRGVVKEILALTEEL